jgi:hypothetical protein
VPEPAGDPRPGIGIKLRQEVDQMTSFFLWSGFALSCLFGAGAICIAYFWFRIGR